MSYCINCRVFTNYVFFLNRSTPRTYEKESYLVTWMHINTKNVNAFCECCRRFSMPEPSSCFGCPAHITPHLIVQTSLSRAGMEFSSGVNNRTIMRCIAFSKLSPDINPSVAKEDMVNSVCFTLYKRASS